jgi:hypothetical protein
MVMAGDQYTAIPSIATTAAPTVTITALERTNAFVLR